MSATAIASADDDLLKIRLFTAKELGELFGISVSQLQKAAAAREIPCVYLTRPGRSKGLLRFTYAQALQIIADSTVDPATRGRKTARAAA